MNLKGKKEKMVFNHWIGVNSALHWAQIFAS